jgi:arylsulfatase A-like enzyme
MANNTTMIVMPEHGRDMEPNPIQDDNDWYAYDHSGGNENTRRIFTLMVGPGIDAGLRIGSEDNQVGDAADIVPTVADLFGIKDVVANQGLLDPNARSLFDRM